MGVVGGGCGTLWMVRGRALGMGWRKDQGKGPEQGRQQADKKLLKIYGDQQSADHETGCCWGRNVRNYTGQTSEAFDG